MNFLVIGASGFVGSHILRRLRQAGHDVIGTQSQPRRADLVTFNLLRHRMADVVDGGWFARGAVTWAIHCTSFGPMDRYAADPAASWLVTVEKPKTLIADLDQLGVRQVLLSTSYVFDGRQGGYTEQQSRAPVSEYGRQKLELEDLFLANTSDSAMLRLDKVVGDDPQENHLLTEWYQTARKGQPILCIADQFLSPTLVDDVALAVLRTCECELRGIYHVANQEVFRRDELARQFLAALGLSERVILRTQDELGLLDRRPQASHLDATKFRLATGLTYTSMREVIDRFRSRFDVHSKKIKE